MNDIDDEHRHSRKKRRTAEKGFRKGKGSGGSQPAVRYHCDYCQVDLSESVRIKCAICADFDLCVDCFSVGVELSGHKREHDYQVVENMHFPILDRKWGADEEILLLEAIMSCGLGNWVDIADHLGTKTAEQCEEHYYSQYTNSPEAPFPVLNRTFNGFVDKSDRMKPPARKKHVPPAPSGPVLQDSGFMPKRLEFETEYLNDAELLLAEMRTNGQDFSPTMQSLQDKVLAIYNYKLMDRYEKRKFLLDNDIFDAKKAARVERAKPKAERDISIAMRPFLQLTDKKCHQRFVDGLVHELRLRNRIAQLQEFRRHGILSLADGEKFLADRKRRDQEQSMRRTREELHGRRGHGSSTSSASGSSVGSLSSGSRKSTVTPLDISSSPDVHLLSQQEQKLCSIQRIFPQQYLIIKDTLLRENLRVGYVKKRSVKAMLNIDPNKAAKFFDFFEAQKWINTTKETPSKSRKSSSGSSSRKSSKRSSGSRSSGSGSSRSNSLSSSAAIATATAAAAALSAANSLSTTNSSSKRSRSTSKSRGKSSRARSSNVLHNTIGIPSVAGKTVPRGAL